jgi:uncharacterized protein YjbI with pentapeptide repeats
MDVQEFIRLYQEGKRDFKGIDLSGADLSSANLTDAILSGADLSSANLTDAILTNVGLTEADLIDADLTGANLTDIDLTDVNLSGAILSGAILTGNYLSRTNLTKANLEGANLGFANLSGANLEGANLEGANLENANLEGANLENANFKNTVLTNTILEKHNNKSLEGWNHHCVKLLQNLQLDFIKRYKQGYLLECNLEGVHSEITKISSEETAHLRDFTWEMVQKYMSKNKHPKNLFINNLKGKLGETLVKYKLGDIINEIDYNLYRFGDGGIDFTLKNNPQLGIQVKTRSGENLTQVSWSISQKEINNNILLACVFSKQEISEAQPDYDLIFAGFIPTYLIKIKEGNKTVSLKAEDLLYAGGIYHFLECI